MIFAVAIASLIAAALGAAFIAACALGARADFEDDLARERRLDRLISPQR